MKVTIQIVSPEEQEKIDLYVHQMDEQLLKLITAVQKKEDTLLGSVGEKTFRVASTDVLYFETVDKKTFMYLNGEKNLRHWCPLSLK